MLTGSTMIQPNSISIRWDDDTTVQSVTTLKFYKDFKLNNKFTLANGQRQTTESVASNTKQQKIFNSQLS